MRQEISRVEDYQRWGAMWSCDLTSVGHHWLERSGHQGGVRGGVLIRSLLWVAVARMAVLTAIGGSVGAHVVDASVMGVLSVVAVRLLDVIQGGVALREV